MKLTLRFILLVVTLLCAVGVSAWQGLKALDQMGAALERVIDSDMERVLAITHVRRLFRSMVVLEGDYLLAKVESERTQMDQKMASLGKEQLGHIEHYARLMPAEDAKAIADIRGARERWIELDKEVRALAATDRDKALMAAKLHGRDPVSWETVIGSLVKLSEKRLNDQIVAAKGVHSQARRALGAVGAAAAAVALGLGFIIFLGIRKNVRELLTLNTNLEKLVSDRTAALAERERSLRIVLESTGDAFIELDRDGRLTGTSSAATVRWFGQYVPGTPGSQYILANEEERQLTFDVAFAQLVDDTLPWEVSADQMPKRTTVGGAILELEYKQVFESGEFSKVLVLARDVTARVQSELAERQAREQQVLLGKLLSDKSGFAQFVTDSEMLLANLSNGGDLQQVKRDLHTLKGNTAIFGMVSFAEQCHRLEDFLAASDEMLPTSRVADLQAQWQSTMQGIQQFLSGLGENVLEIASEDHQNLVESLMHRRDYQEILAMVEKWSWRRASERLTRLRAQTEYIAARLGKDIHVVVEHNDIRIPNDYLSRLWPALVHIVRNALVHGVEDASERRLAGKPPSAKIGLAAAVVDNHLVIAISDDGRGINEEAVRAAAAAKGIRLLNEHSLIDVITADGVTTSSEATDLSGRGVGLSAVRHACDLEGGQFSVVNSPGKGVTFRLQFRAPVVKTGALAAKLEKRWSLMPPRQAAAAPRASATVRLDSGTSQTVGAAKEKSRSG